MAGEYAVAGRRLLLEEEPVLPAQYARTTVEGGSAHDLAQELLAGMQSSIEAQVDWRLRQHGALAQGRVTSNELGVILGSIGVGIPLMVIAAAVAHLAGVIVICVMLITVNAIWARR